MNQAMREDISGDKNLLEMRAILEQHVYHLGVTHCSCGWYANLPAKYGDRAIADQWAYHVAVILRRAALDTARAEPHPENSTASESFGNMPSMDGKERTWWRGLYLTDEEIAARAEGEPPQGLIDNASEPLRKLAARLTELLDDDHWNEIEPYLLVLAGEQAAPGLRDGEVERLADAAEDAVVKFEQSLSDGAVLDWDILGADVAKAVYDAAALTAPVPRDEPLGTTDVDKRAQQLIDLNPGSTLSAAYRAADLELAATPAPVKDARPELVQEDVHRGGRE